MPRILVEVNEEDLDRITPASELVVEEIGYPNGASLFGRWVLTVVEENEE